MKPYELYPPGGDISDSAELHESRSEDAKISALHDYHLRGIVTGDVEPNDEECDWPSDDEDVDNLSENVKEKVTVSNETEDKGLSDDLDEKENSHSHPARGGRHNRAPHRSKGNRNAEERPECAQQ
ncbi:unnamed protein product [Trichobilharzia regenti]|nr:unnamed protein product [Trichobilharzia regenti]